MGRVIKTMHYIAFMDLLGTKAMAIANPAHYRKIIEAFHNIIDQLRREYNAVEIYVFSDCAYLEDTNFENLCKLFKKMRERLLEKEICFNAAICEGALGARKADGEKYVIVDFNDEQVVKVYGLQSCFTGAGIYIDPYILNDKDIYVKLNGILVDSIYANVNKEDGKFIYRNCKDIKFQRNSEELLQFILNLYVKTYFLDRRAARYYYTIYATYINEQGIDDFLDDEMRLINLIINSVQKLYDYDGKVIILMLLINHLYDAMEKKLVEENEEVCPIDLDDVNYELYNALSYIYEKGQMEKVCNIRDVSSEVISDKNKLLFADFLIKKMKGEQYGFRIRG